MIAEIRAARDRLNFQFTLIQQEKDKVDLRLQAVFSNQMAIRSAGLVEKSVQLILSEYGRRRSNEVIANFISRQISWENSLNCEKIEKILGRFDKDWWGKVKSMSTEESMLAVDSLKTIRDQLAHGNDNGTGLVSIKSYHEAAVLLIDSMDAVILPV